MKRRQISLEQKGTADSTETVRVCAIATKSYRWGLFAFNALSGVDLTCRQRWYRTGVEARSQGLTIYGRERFVVCKAPW